jgi:peptide deformylase
VAVRTILTADKPVLRIKARPVQKVDQAIRKLLEDMVDTMRDAPGVGLAGPQVGESLRLVVIEYDENLYKLVNPEIVWHSSETITDDEGCLSIPGYIGAVTRASKVRVRAKNERGKAVTFEAEDWLARICQHEIDHLDGILFTDRMAPGERLRPATIAEEVVEPVPVTAGAARR